MRGSSKAAAQLWEKTYPCKKLQDHMKKQNTDHYDKAGQGVKAGQGRAGQGRAGQGRAGQGRAGQGKSASWRNMPACDKV